MTEQTASKVPQIRFNGFEGDWEEKKLGESTANVANNTLSRANLNYRSGLARNVHYGDILVRFGEVLDVQSDAVPFVSDDAVVKKLMSSNLENGDIVLADAAEDEMVGKCTEIQNVGDQIVLAGLHTIPLRPLVHFAPFYLGYYLNSDRYHDQLLPIMQGTKVLSISKTAIKQTAISFPADEAEQTQIGEYFRELDSLIELHQRKHDKLVTLKKAMLQKMFPQPGATTPEIRFKGFSGEWVEKKLGEEATFLKGKGLPKSSLVPNGAEPCIHYGELFTRYPEIIGEIISRTNSSLGAFRSNANDVLMPTSDVTPRGLAKASCLTVDGVILGGDILVIRSDVKRICGSFLSYVIRREEGQVLQFVTGSTVFHLYGSSMKNFIFSMPLVSEQTAIAAYFHTLDKLISQHATQLQKLQQIKFACLEKMFV